MLKYNSELVEREIEGQPPEAGDAKDIENAFEIVEEFSESVSNADLRWYQDAGLETALSSILAMADSVT